MLATIHIRGNTGSTQYYRITMLTKLLHSTVFLISHPFLIIFSISKFVRFDQSDFIKNLIMQHASLMTQSSNS